MTAVGFDVTALAVAELAQHGIELRPHGTVSLVSKADRRWLTHSEVDVRYPRRGEQDRAIARQAAGWWASRHEGSVKGLQLSRSFPCLGAFRVDPSGGVHTGPVVVVCDTCGARFGVRRSEFDEAFGMPPLSPDPSNEAAKPEQDEEEMF